MTTNFFLVSEDVHIRYLWKQSQQPQSQAAAGFLLDPNSRPFITFQDLYPTSETTCRILKRLGPPSKGKQYVLHCSCQDGFRMAFDQSSNHCTLSRRIG